MIVRTIHRHAVAAVLLGLALIGASVASAADPSLKPSGKVEIEQVQVAFLVSGNLGGGTLTYRGRTHRFDIGGLGVGGIGASRMKATGTVYNLNRLEDFPGAYVQARAGFALGDVSRGKLWLENGKGVYIELAAEREGLAASLGGDAVTIQMKD